MSSSFAGDGGGRQYGQSLSTGKIKHKVSRNNEADKDWTLVTGEQFQNKSSNSVNPILPNFQHILDKHPVLNLNRSTFNCNSTLSPYNNPHIEHMFLDSNLSQCITKSSSIKVLDNNNASICTNSSNTVSRNNNSTRDLPIRQTLSFLNPNLITFSEDFKDLPIIIKKYPSNDCNIGKLHPMKVDKLFFNNFQDIRRIDPIESRVKVTFDAIHFVNYCLSSEELLPLRLCTYIPSTLMYSYSIINMDISVFEEGFLEGLESAAKVVNFRRTQLDNSPTPNKIIEFKYLSHI